MVRIGGDIARTLKTPGSPAVWVWSPYTVAVRTTLPKSGYLLNRGALYAEPGTPTAFRSFTNGFTHNEAAAMLGLNVQKIVDCRSSFLTPTVEGRGAQLSSSGGIDVRRFCELYLGKSAKSAARLGKIDLGLDYQGPQTVEAIVAAALAKMTCAPNNDLGVMNLTEQFGMEAGLLPYLQMISIFRKEEGGAQVSHKVGLVLNSRRVAKDFDWLAFLMNVKNVKHLYLSNVAPPILTLAEAVRTCLKSPDRPDWQRRAYGPTIGKAILSKDFDLLWRIGLDQTDLIVESGRYKEEESMRPL